MSIGGYILFLVIFWFVCWSIAWFFISKDENRRNEPPYKKIIRESNKKMKKILK